MSSNKMEPVLAKAFEVFGKNYQPTTAKRCEHKTTTEIMNLFNELTGLYSDKQEIAEGLEANGYTFVLIGDEFSWQLEKV